MRIFPYLHLLPFLLFLGGLWSSKPELFDNIYHIHTLKILQCVIDQMGYYFKFVNLVMLYKFKNSS